MSEYLKCDAPGCIHVETVPDITADMIGKPCPVCGANLLTAADYAVWDKSFRPMIDVMEKAGLIRTEGVEPDGNLLNLSINFHDGNLHVKLPKVSGE